MSSNLKGRKITGEMSEFALMNLLADMKKGELLRFEYVDIMIDTEKGCLFGVEANYVDKFPKLKN